MSALRGPLNHDFYTTSAAVIPVLLLAIAFQSPTFAAMTARIRESGRSSSGVVRLVGVLLQVVAAAILVAGIGGEIVSLAVLKTQHATTRTEDFVFWSQVLLIVFLLLTLLPTAVPSFLALFVVRVDTDALSLDTSPGEQIVWSGRAVRWRARPPWTQATGRLFVTTERVVFVVAPLRVSWQCKVADLRSVSRTFPSTFPGNLRLQRAGGDDLVCRVLDRKGALAALQRVREGRLPAE